MIDYSKFQKSLTNLILQFENEQRAGQRHALKFA